MNTDDNTLLPISAYFSLLAEMFPHLKYIVGKNGGGVGHSQRYTPFKQEGA